MNRPRWSDREDVIIDAFNEKYSSKTGVAVADIIEKKRPDGIHPSRYEGTALKQHVNWRRRQKKNDENQ